MCLKWGQNTKSSVTPKLIIYKACQILSEIFWAFYETSTLICKEHIKKMLISENHCRYFWVNWESQNIWFSVIAVHCNIVSMMLQLGPKKFMGIHSRCTMMTWEKNKWFKRIWDRKLHSSQGPGSSQGHVLHCTYILEKWKLKQNCTSYVNFNDLGGFGGLFIK